MYCRLFLVSAVLTCTGKSLVHGQSKKVLAFEGGDVILPCRFNVTANGDFPNVEWSKEGLEPNVVLLYRDGCETYEMKNPVFEYRTSLIPKELQNGNISVRISKVQRSDAGRYQCLQLWKNAPRDVTTVELVVGTVSEPKLSVVSAECGGLTLQCEANFSLAEPEITFLDDQGNKIPAEDPKRDEDGSGNYTVRRRMTLKTATDSITCRVHQPQFSLVRDQRIFIPADFMRSCYLTSIITIGGIVFGLVLVCGVAVCIWKRCGKSAKAHRPSVASQESNESTDTSTYEDQSLLNVNASTENMVHSSTETHEREVDRLRLELHEQKRTNSELQNKLKSQDLKIRPVVCQNTQPTIVCSAPESSPTGCVPNPITDDHTSKPAVSTHANPPKSANLCQNKDPQPSIQKQICNPALWQHVHHRTNSSPARLSSSPVMPSSSLASASKKNQEHVGRSKSDSSTQHVPNLSKLHHRHQPVSMPGTNRYSLLAHLNEDSEQLKVSRKCTKQF